MNRTVMLVGPSQIGKDSLMRRLIREFDFTPHVNATTRQPRQDAPSFPPEYEFLSREAFQARIRNRSLLDWAYYAGEYYGVTPRHEPFGSPVMHCGAAMAVRISSRNPDYVPIFLRPREAGRIRDRILDRFGTELGSLRVSMMAEELDHLALFDHVVDVLDFASEDRALHQILNILGDLRDF